MDQIARVTDERREAHSANGSALIVALFVLFLVTAIGVALLFLTRNEVDMSQADGRGKRVYYLAEAGLEDGRTTVGNANRVSLKTDDLSDELDTAAGPDDVINFNVDNIAPVYDGNGNVTGFTGFGDDVPARGLTALDDGWYTAFLTNDVNENPSTIIDNNDIVMITGIGVAADRSLEITEAVVQYDELFPSLPATITILGPNAIFDGGNSNAKSYVGDDCPGGLLPPVPVVGTIGGVSETHAEIGVHKPGTYESNGQSGDDTVSDLIPLGVDPMWTDCDALVALARGVMDAADVVGDSSTPLAALGTPASPKIVFIDDDYDVSGNFTGAGLLLVTGLFEFDGKADWQGVLLAIGQGDFVRKGGGNGNVLGGAVVANVEGPDQILFTADDCSGDDGVKPSGDDGVAQSSFDASGGGGLKTQFCSPYFTRLQAAKPLEILSFRQR